MLPATGAQARPEYWAAIQQIYHPKLGSALAKQQCMTCHTSGFEDDPGQQQRYLNAYEVLANVCDLARTLDTIVSCIALKYNTVVSLC